MKTSSMQNERSRRGPAEIRELLERLPRRRRFRFRSPAQRLRSSLTCRPVVQASIVVAVLAAMAFPIWAQQGQPAGAPSSTQAIRAKIEHYLRERFSIAPAAIISVGPLEPSIYPGFLKTTVTMESGKDKSSQDFYVTKDGGYLIAGTIYGLNSNPTQEVERQINLSNQPSEGPANAPVTIVEYADLECPHCAVIQQFLEKDLLPKYGSRVRLVFKEFPLYTVHPWAVQAAVADECAFQINPADFLPYRSLIFQNQSSIKTETLRQQLLDFGAQAGLDRQKLAACYDAKAALPRVKADFLEGQKLGVNTTPTLFVNGKMVVGDISPADFYKIVDEALARTATK